MNIRTDSPSSKNASNNGSLTNITFSNIAFITYITTVHWHIVNILKLFGVSLLAALGFSLALILAIIFWGCTSKYGFIFMSNQISHLLSYLKFRFRNRSKGN